MRFLTVAALLMAGTAMPAAAQKQPIEKRVEKIEGELRAVQRKVFPAGNVEPEIRPEDAAAAPGGVPASSPVADLNARVDALEAQLARLTGSNEEAANRVRVLEEALNKFKGDAEYRLAAIEGARQAPAGQPAAEAAPPPQPPAQASKLAAVEKTAPASTPAATPAAAPADEAETAYLDGFRKWEAGQHADAAPLLEAMAKKYPKHRRASYAQNLAGRAYLDDGKPATAAKLLLANYQANPKGERAADSLYFLGQALARLDKNAEACKVYDELAEVYPNMRDWLKQRLPQARTEAKCDG
jgi:TolA-binding protein